ncbi:EamA family transporter [Mangrovicoccus ximenensis]|uniref:EamA family transporter n=1 Tax=Mangrovicoccus ximenensis TaxID=1911570 RepID=UPI001F00B1BC|nr:EamA family transporter [Mangrovicoccus ximenensis]
MPDELLWASRGFQTLIVCAASFLVWFRLLQIYPASRLGVLSLMTPLFGAALGALLLGEQLAPGFLAGGALLLSGMAVVQGHELIQARRRTGTAAAAIGGATGQADMIDPAKSRPPSFRSETQFVRFALDQSQDQRC